ncbi:MAG: hypothetical protein KDD51_09210, partial [Bdellovibrionales bacterium]|nr:hypothetical protein [Bdellovibrionales bacterium]
MIQALKTQVFRNFDQAEHGAWQTVYQNLEGCRDHQAFPAFNDGLKALHIHGDRIPDLEAVNERLSKLT